ncbi:hypothetical protein JCM15831A_13020 [Asaia astilbis]
MNGNALSDWITNGGQIALQTVMDVLQGAVFSVDVTAFLFADFGNSAILPQLNASRT